jgi:hypothetical protein
LEEENREAREEEETWERRGKRREVIGTSMGEIRKESDEKW